MIKEIRHNSVYKQLLFLGDIHGEFMIVKHYVNRYKLTDTVIIQVGDFGIGYGKDHEDRMLTELNYHLVKCNCVLYAIRGNHDNPTSFTNEWKYSNIFVIDDWTVLNINIDNVYERIFCFGGAISVDRLLSKENDRGWWPDEVPRFDDSLIDDVKNITKIVTHTAPEWVEPYYFNDIVYHFAGRDSTLMHELKIERRQMTYMFDRIYENNKETLTHHYYGHFHFSSVQEHNGVIVRLLDIKEIC